MSWYRAGTVSVTNGLAAVTGAGTAFIDNLQPGDAFLGPDGRTYEVTGIVSATSLTIAPAYLGSTASAQAYAVQPGRGWVKRLNDTISTWLSAQQAYLDGPLAGRFPNGTGLLPGITDGTLVCTRVMAGSAGGTATWNFPAAFSAAPAVSAAVQATVLSTLCLDAAPSTTAATFSLRDKADARRADMCD